MGRRVEEKIEEKMEKKTEQEAAVAVQEKKVEETTGAVADATQAVGEAVEKKAEQEAAVAVQEKKVEAAVKVEEKAASVVEKSGQAATTTVESVVIDNKNGKVVLQHKRHAEAYGCAACHGDQKPGPFKLGKEKAHALCQGCHKEKNGPTSCNKCHQKKRKAAEGC